MGTRGADKRQPGRQPDNSPCVLAPGGAGNGPAAVVRELARDLLRQQRIQIDEASRIEQALRDHDWSTVRTYVDRGLARRVPGAREREEAAPPVPAPSAADVPAAGAVPPARADAVASAPDGAVDNVALAQGLLRLVMRLCDALPRLAGNDETFGERFAPIRTLLTARLTPERVDEAERLICALVEQQLEMQRGLQDAHTSLKDTLALVVNQLGVIGSSTTRFQERVSAYQEELAGPPDAALLARVAGGLLADTRVVTEEIGKSQKDLAETRRKVESYELRLRSLEHELAQTSRMAQKDPLTHVLNRRGLDEVFRIEVSRASRYRVALTVVMIDLDDFKTVNDTLGHAAGDRALVHFATTARAVLRSTEMIARTGGEEFVVVFPATGIASSVDAVRRLQGELARSAFAYEGQSCVLTFSAGAAEWRQSESLAQILRRADEAMYRAKRAGKDCVALSE